MEVDRGKDVPVIDLALRRSCTIAGRVVDEFGEPVTLATVSARERYERDDGTPRQFQRDAARTNDLGQFRISGLPAGKYFLVAEPPTLGPDDIEDGDRAKRVDTYYPGTADFDAAQPIRLAPGQTMEVAIALARPIRTMRVSGSVVDAGGKPPRPGASVSVSGMEASRYYKHVPLQDDGTFTVPGVLPGAYSLRVFLRAAGGRPQEWGLARATVAGRDVSGIVIRTGRGSTLSGRVVFEGASVPPAGSTRIRVEETGEDSSGFSSLIGSVGEQGTFTLAPLFAECLIRVFEPPGWTLKAVRVNGRDVTDTPVMFDGRETITGAEIVLTDRVTHLDVSVQTDEGRPVEPAYVVVMPDDPGKWRLIESRYHRKTWAEGGKPVTFDALPPGDYFAYALTADAALADSDESWLTVTGRLRKTATKFSLREGEQKALLLKPVGLDGK